MKLIIPILFSLLPLAKAICQDTDIYEEKYQWRIQQEELYGVYIPKDVNDALIQLNNLMDKDSKEKFKAMSEDDAVHKLFFSLGRWMTHNWSLYEGSRLSVYLQSMGIHHPDDMCSFIIRVYHRSLNQQELGIKVLLEEIQGKEKLKAEERKKKSVIIYEEKRKVPPPAASGNGNGN